MCKAVLLITAERVNKNILSDPEDKLFVSILKKCVINLMCNNV